MAADFLEGHVGELADEPLIDLAVTWDQPWARDALFVRHFPGVAEAIGVSGAALRLSLEDIEDARQRAALAVLEAIFLYHGSRLSVPEPKPFPEFVRWLAAVRFKDFMRAHYRHERRLDRSVDVAFLEQPVAGESEARWEREVFSALEKFAEQLSANDRRLWKAIATREALGRTAARLGVSVSTVKRRRTWLLTRARDVLGPLLEADKTFGE